MGYAIPFVRNFKYFNQPNIQLNINYKPKIKELDTFISEYGAHRINFICSEKIQNKDFDIILSLREKYPKTKIVICMPFYNNEIENELNKYSLPHYYNEFVNNWDKFQGFLKLNITDIFIAEDLGFCVKDLSYNAKKKGIQLRSFCNICESSWDKTPSLKTFFIRPEDIELYQDYIDTFEFYIDDSDATRINTLYEIYAKNKKWFGYLSEIIVGYEGNEDNRFIVPRFGEKRLSCEKKCMRGGKQKCELCDTIIKLEQTFKQFEILPIIKKKKQ